MGLKVQDRLFCTFGDDQRSSSNYNMNGQRMGLIQILQIVREIV